MTPRSQIRSSHNSAVRSLGWFPLLALPVVLFGWMGWQHQSSTADGTLQTSHLKSHDAGTSRTSPKFILTPQVEFQPGIVWLMSFPNSGTSFTMTLVERASNKSFATNYGEEVLQEGQSSQSIYPLREEGPYWKANGKRDLPEKYIMVKTHCGARCVNCGPEEYVSDVTDFVKACASGHGRLAVNGPKVMVQYPPQRVKRAIHLFRHPLHNVIARFHLERKNHIAREGEGYGISHPSNSTGFLKWCHDLDTGYQRKDEEYFQEHDPDMLALMQQIPCHGEFYKYAQWHSLALASIRGLQIESLVLHYEDYDEDLAGTLQKLLDFLELDLVGSVREFSSHEYVDYITPEQWKHIETLMERVATPETYDYIRRYFE